MSEAEQRVLNALVELGARFALAVGRRTCIEVAAGVRIDGTVTGVGIGDDPFVVIDGTRYTVTVDVLAGLLAGTSSAVEKKPE